MKTVTNAISALGLVAISSLCHAQDVGSVVSTIAIDVNVVQSGSGVLYVRTQSPGVGPAGCPNLDYIFARESEPDYKTFTALILLAKATNKKMSFSGYCQASGNYLRITYAIAY